MGNRLLVARDEISGRVARYDYDEVDNLISAEYERGGEVERLYRVSDRMGNLFETRERDDRRYDAGGRLAEDREHFYHYDCEGNLVFKEFKEMVLHGGIVAPINKERLETELGIRFRAFGTGWRYDWQSDGMLARVVRPDGKEVSFAYDALGRRIRKSFAGTTTQFVWDGNVPLHEWTEEAEESMVTWLFEQDTFVPAAKLVANGECFSIISDYLGTPLQAYDKQGNKVWEQELDIYGRQRKRPSAFIPFKYQGQYEDAETGLYYNRFRYYDPNAGSYISQDPIGLAGGSLILYMYVSNSNNLIDPFGLSRRGNQATRDHIEVVKDKFMSDNPGATHIGGGLDDAGNQMKEVYIRPSKPIPGSTKGGSYTDLTFKTADGKIVHINTVDKGNFNGMSKREFTNLNRIKADAPDTVVIAIGKGDDPGDLSMNKAKTSSH
ncbi:RHS repeat domain-containing protein [Prevotella jejuni]|uniref:RHS repeat domain-containing protein n=1 Tax=Prevotella jejuni TaxID=1177574 RepID=UPI003211939F